MRLFTTVRFSTLLKLAAPLAVMLGAVPLSAAELDPGPKASEAARHGEALAITNCAKCHSVAIEGESPHPKAPPFWFMSHHRAVDTIATMLLDKAGPKHSDMPNFTITQKQATDLASWIAWIQPIAHGKRLVEENCSACHAIGTTDTGSHKEAPPFRTLSQFYPIEALEEAFAEGIETGHPDMPVFEVDIIDLQDMLAYIESIQTP
jgi:mono/diheme cytochrome c family protein